MCVTAVKCIKSTVHNGFFLAGDVTLYMINLVLFVQYLRKAMCC